MLLCIISGLSPKENIEDHTYVHVLAISFSPPKSTLNFVFIMDDWNRGRYPEEVLDVNLAT